jgi:hypothetical protein
MEGMRKVERRATSDPAENHERLPPVGCGCSPDPGADPGSDPGPGHSLTGHRTPRDLLPAIAFSPKVPIWPPRSSRSSHAALCPVLAPPSVPLPLPLDRYFCKVLCSRYLLIRPAISCASSQRTHARHSAGRNFFAGGDLTWIVDCSAAS